jgi:Ca-activated chloride channel family protein
VTQLRAIALTLTACACLPLALAKGHAQPQDGDAGQSTIRVQVRLVSVFVNVTDSHGAPVPGLSKSNFALAEDGVPQAVSIFERQTNVPLSVALAIDTSGSTHSDEGADRRAAHDFANVLLSPADKMALFAFDSDVRQVVPFTASIHQIDRGLENLGHGPATAFYNAILLASQTLAPVSGRKVLVVVSDGGDTVGETSYEEAVSAAQKGNVIIYSLIDVPIEADAGRNTAGEHAMITMSQETGGQFFYVDQGGLAAAFRKVSDDLRTQYLLAYYPRRAEVPSDPLAPRTAFRSIRVVLRDTPPGAEYTAHYRNGYYRTSAGR